VFFAKIAFVHENAKIKSKEIALLADFLAFL